MDQKLNKSLTKITKLVLVIYCLVLLCALIVFVSISVTQNNYPLLWGFLLCLGPGIIFVFVSCIFPISRVVTEHLGKSGVVWCVIGYVIKYGLLIGIPFIGIVNPDTFNRWVMLGMTCFSPVVVLVYKVIIANIVSKNSKSDEKKQENSIKF